MLNFFLPLDNLRSVCRVSETPVSCGAIHIFKVYNMMWKYLLPLAVVSFLGGSFDGAAIAEELLIAPAANEKPLNDLFSKQWVKVDAQGGIEGSLVELTSFDKRPLSGLPVNLVRDGRIVVSSTSDGSGKFRFDNVAPGLYSLVTRTNQSFSALALQVLDAEKGSHLSNSIEVRPVRSAGNRVKDIVRAQTIPAFLASVAEADSVVQSNDPIANERRFALTHVVKLDGSGNLVGQLAKPGLAAASSGVSGTTVFVLKGEEEIARAEADENGRFTISSLVPGVYGFVAAGAGGIGATSFQVVDAGVALKSADGKKMVAVNLQDCCPVLNCEIVPTTEVTCCEPQVVETIIEEPIVACEQPIVEEACGCGEIAPACGGGCGCGWGGGYGGGGGGGGGGLFGAGGGGFGNILGLAGLAGVAAVIADSNDDDSTNLNQPPIRISPVTN